MKRERTPGEKLAPLVLVAFIALAIFGGVDPVVVVIGGAGCGAFAVMVALLWNARLNREAMHESQAAIDDAAAQTGGQPGKYTREMSEAAVQPRCTTFVCGDENCFDCIGCSCDVCGRALYEHGASWVGE
jgi:hypothetical protein